ncbi:MAG: SusD/RagB family nutrient-binding outer membrane lipoprotein [Saprospiraceae bacterium]|nr:SusD/RagB family nutrient-binding outer membrane lipoprotein [Saprospiraceae bacterium]
MNRQLKNILLIFFLLGTISCEKGFEDINRNPFFPTQTDIGPLFNSVVESLKLGWNEQFYLHNETLYGVTQLAALTAETFQNITIGTEEVWSNYYSTLANIRELETRFDEYGGEQEALQNVRAMVKTILAYKTFRVTDFFGDMPFFDAGRGFQDIDLIKPAFDSQEEIYKFLLEDLKWVNDNINTLPFPTTSTGADYVSFAGFDNLFKNDMLKWQKFANSLRLRYALRMVEVDPGFANPIIKEILEGDLPLIEEGEDVGLYPADLDWLNESVHWSFREHKKLRMGSTIWNQLSETDATDGSGIYDPRAYIFFETNNNGEWAAFPQVPDDDTPASGGIPYQIHRDINYSLKGLGNIYSPFNYYLIRDEDYIPELIMTAAEINFIKAEIYLRGLGVAVDEDLAKSEYTLGVVNSMVFWQSIFMNTPIWQNAPQVLTEGQLFAITNHPRINIFSATDKLENIYAQRWLDAFRQPWEAFALWRRTNATPREGDAPEFYRFSYPPSEAENNPDNWSEQVGTMGEDSPRVKVWWMK